jgi:hypothetical protein
MKAVEIDMGMAGASPADPHTNVPTAEIAVYQKTLPAFFTDSGSSLCKLPSPLHCQPFRIAFALTPSL